MNDEWLWRQILNEFRIIDSATPCRNGDGPPHLPSAPAPFPCAAWSMHRAPARARCAYIHHSPHVPHRQPLTTPDGRFQGVPHTSRPAQPPTAPPEPMGAVTPHDACHERLHMQSASHEDFISSNPSPPPRATASPCPLLPRKRVRAPERRGLTARIFLTT